MFQNLQISEIIDIFGIITSLTVSIIAIAISVITLRQNSKMIEESSRPNIQIYPIYIDSIMYIVIKNFGSSEAVIDKIECTHDFTEAEFFGPPRKNVFNSLQGAIFSPGYSLRCPLISYAVSNEIFDFQIKYHSSKKEYKATFSFNPYVNAPFADTYPSANSMEEHVHNISKDLHSIFKLNL